jgi:hypothetical protein
MKHGFLLTILSAILVSVSSCTKVININLNDSSPRIIIEGSISDKPSSCFIRISKSVNYNLPNTFPAIIGAYVTIADNLGNSSVLSETADGYYSAISFTGVPGRTYTVSVTIDGRSYTATSAMPYPVTIDSISQDIFLFGNFGGNGKIKFVKIQYQDPAGKANFYRFIEIINGKPTDAILIDNDVLRDGETIIQDIIRRDPAVQTGDTVQILLQTIDKQVFTYFEQLNQTLNEFGGQTATPANPVSNFNNGALGYFSAFAVRSGTIVIK